MTNADDAETTRRRFLAAVGGVAGATFAGCLGGSAADSVANSPSVFGHAFPHLTDNAQLNPWGTQYPEDFAALVYDPIVETTPSGRREKGPMLEELTIDGTTVTVTYDDTHTWWNGDDVTAHDPWVAHRIDTFVSPEATPEASLLDDRTIRYDLEQPRDRQLVLANVVRTIDTAASTFRQWLERFLDASSEDARQTVATDLQNWAFSLEDVKTNGHGFGPYELTEVSPNRLLLERFEDYPDAEALSIPKLWLPAAKHEQSNGLIGQGELDGGQGLLTDRGVKHPDYIEQLVRYPTVGGTKLVFNWRNDHLARKNVRRAILSVLSLPTIVEKGDWGMAATTQTGLAKPSVEYWLDDATRGDLREYPVESDTDRAVGLLRDAGYTRRGGRWHGPNGNTVSLRLDTLLNDRWGTSAGLLEQSLTDFGFRVDVKQSPVSSFLSTSRRNEYDLLLWWTTGRPFVAYDMTDASPATLGYGVTDPSSTVSELGRPVEPSVPTGNDDTHTVNLLEEWRRIERPGPKEATARATETFARWWNDSLPDIYLATATSGVWGNTRDFAWPNGNRSSYRTTGSGDRPVYSLLRRGAIESGTEN